MTLKSFSGVLVPFVVHRMPSAKALWINKWCSPLDPNCDTRLWTKDYVEKSFAFGVLDRNCFHDLEFDEKRTKICLADRYGGTGVGVNGGSARAGIIDSFYVKGIGPTPLLGSKEPLWHAHGGQSLIDATLEAVMSTVLNHILPIGTVACRAMIYTGATASLALGPKGELQRGPGALLIRDVNLRPAHFLPAEYFPSHVCDRLKIEGQGNHLERINFQLNELLGGKDGVLKFIQKFLDRCANQFSFARIFRIFHGVVSPSNLAFDGRWLDLTNAGFVNSAINYSETPETVPFFNEIDYPLSLASNVLDSYGKFNNINFDSVSIESFYNSRVNYYLGMHATSLLGIPSSIFAQLRHLVFYRSLAVEINRRIWNNQIAVMAGSAGDFIHDPLTTLIEGIFLSLASGEVSILGLRDFFDSAHRSCGMSIQFGIFLVTCSIRALRVALFSNFFSRRSILLHLNREVDGGNVYKIETFIECCIAISRWVYLRDYTTSETVIDVNGIRILFNPHSAVYCVSDGEEVCQFNRVSDVMKWVQVRPTSAFLFAGYDFHLGLISLLSVVEKLELSWLI